MAQLINLRIKVDKNKIQIEFSPSTTSTTVINTTVKQLEKKYKITIEQLSSEIVRQIIKDDKLKKYTLTDFSSQIITRTNYQKTFKFQTEDNLTHITNLNTGAELFCPSYKIKNFDSFSENDFRILLETKQKITPAKTNIQTSFNLFD